MQSCFQSPLSNRYASQYMVELFSAQTRIQTWRTLWTELARAEQELGLPITAEQVTELENHISDIDFELASNREKVISHDVMSHIYAYGIAAPSAASIIHLGATSCYVTDNADLIIYRNALRYLRKQLLAVINNLISFANTYKSIPTVGYTHYQPAQLVTIGKRASIWLQDFISDLEDLDYVLQKFKFLGCKGSTGTEASLLNLFDGDHSKVIELNEKLCRAFKFDQCFDVSNQTYPRKLDSNILNCLSSIAQSCYRMANDIRLLQHDHQIEEAFSIHQVGSSAMPYKQNPMHCERICSLSRYLIVNSLNAPLNASNQWLERSLDDSANRRIVMPESFLSVDAILSLTQKITHNLQVNKKIIAQTVDEYLSFTATEKLLMEGVKQGGDRQKLHEIIRQCSQEASFQIKEGGKCDLLQKLANYPEFPLSKETMKTLLNPQEHIGRCVEQVDTYLKKLQNFLALEEKE